MRDQPLERLLHQLLARLHVVEDLMPEDEEAAVDPEVGVLRPVAMLRDLAVLVRRRPRGSDCDGWTQRKLAILPSLAGSGRGTSGKSRSVRPSA